MTETKQANAAGPGCGPLRRFDSIDQVRGAVMILMALDHKCWFFTDLSACWIQKVRCLQTQPFLCLAEVSLRGEW
jgi:uncharacterized membrane protein